MFRKLTAVAVALMLVVGGLYAEEIKGEFVKVDGGKVTIKVDGKEKSYKIADVKVKIGKDKEGQLSEALGKWKEGTKGTFNVDKDEVNSAKKEKTK